MQKAYTGSHTPLLHLLQRSPGQVPSAPVPCDGDIVPTPLTQAHSLVHQMSPGAQLSWAHAAPGLLEHSWAGETSLSAASAGLSTGTAQGPLWGPGARRRSPLAWEGDNSHNKPVNELRRGHSRKEQGMKLGQGVF